MPAGPRDLPPPSGPIGLLVDMRSLETRICRSSRIWPNTAEIARACGYSTGEIARILDAPEHMGYITRIPGRRRNIRLCLPSVKMLRTTIFIFS